MLGPGEQVHVPDMHAPDGQFEPFVRAMLRALSASLGISYSTLSRDSSQSNYSSSRLDVLQDQESFKALQAQLREIVLFRVYKEWLEIAVLSGALQLSNYQTEPERYEMARFMFKSTGWVDPFKECQSNKLAVESGFKLQSSVLAEQGLDLEEFLVARKNEIQMAEELGLSFSTELNMPTQAKVDETTNNPIEENGT
jgi:lambda family phage portal protein